MLRHAVNVLSVRWFGAGLSVSYLLRECFRLAGDGAVRGLLRLPFGAAAGSAAFPDDGHRRRYTTFSAFSLDAVLLPERGQWALSAIYVAGSILLSIGGLVVGLAHAEICMSAERKFFSDFNAKIFSDSLSPVSRAVLRCARLDPRGARPAGVLGAGSGPAPAGAARRRASGTVREPASGYYEPARGAR